jgi:tetratricopeptide (TPR) repeat protein
VCTRMAFRYRTNNCHEVRLLFASRRSTWPAIVLVIGVGLCAGQTFDVGGQTSSPPPKNPQHQSKQAPDQGMGWGSSIEVAREARAAQTALQHGDAKSATEHAQRAVNAAPQNADLWFTLAYAARLSGQYPLSVDAYQRGLSIKPASVQGLSGLAQTYARMGRNAEAQQMLDKVLAANPTSETDLQLAGELLLPTDPKKAADFFRRAEAAKPSARTELLLARAYDRSGDKDSAHKMLERAQLSAPSNPEVLRAVASYYRDTGNNEEAIRVLEGLRVKDANTLAELGYSYTLAGNFVAAARVYGEAASRVPGNIEVQLNAAQAMISAADFGKANEILNHVSSLNPRHYRLHALRGRLYAAQNEDADAIREYEAALQELPAAVPEGVLYPISLRMDLEPLYRAGGDSANADRVTKQAADAIGAIDISGADRPEFLRLRALAELDQGHADSAEKDLKEAIRLQPRSIVLLLNYANLLGKTERKKEAEKVYQDALAIDPGNAAALGSLGSLARESGDFEGSRRYFTEFAKRHPDNYAPYLALGDLYSEKRQFAEAQENYDMAFKRAPENPLIVAGAMNAALESHELARAGQWLSHASEMAQQDPQVMREHERYLTMTGNYGDSANLGYQVIQKLPKDREAADYLAYDLLFLKRNDEAMEIVNHYRPLLEHDRDLPLIAGYIHAQSRQYDTAVEDFTVALQIDPDMAVGYMNRGYVYNDMRLATKAEQDFRKALTLNPRYGEAHLGLAYALVQLRRAGPALKEADTAAALLPDSESLHLVKAEAYRQRAMHAPAESEYRKALMLNPNTANTYVALADVEYRGHRYANSVETLRKGQAVAPNDAMILAQLGRSYAKLQRTDDAIQAINAAERTAGKDYKSLLVAADALRILKRRDQAMTIYSRALEGSDENRLEVRLALGRLFAEEGKDADAQQQVALGLAESRVASVDVTSADDYLNAADVLMGIHEYPLAQRMYGRAQALGADDVSVAVGMANASLALGDTHSAELQLASVPQDQETKDNFEFLVAQGDVYRQSGKNDLALANFTRASQLDPDNELVSQTRIELAEEQGRAIKDQLGIGAEAHVVPIFEDENIYQLDARLLGVQKVGTLLPPPRRSIETFAASRFRFHSDSALPVQGFVAERNAQGSVSFPSELLIQDRNTFDTILNVGVAPTVKFGEVKLSVMPGMQFTLRRDSLAPTPMNQNLFRQFVYLNSNSIGNWFSFSGDLIREAGPFTEQGLHSRDLSGTIDFRVGRPWSKTTLLTGYSARNLLFTPNVSGDYRDITEYYQTVSYAGLERSFGSRIRVSAAAEFLRAWRIEHLEYALAQTLRPRFGIDARIRQRWELSANGAWSSGRSFHSYDSVTSNVLLSYTRDRGLFSKDASETASGYPLKFSFGIGQQTFYNFPGHERTQIVPAAQLNF